MPEQRKYTPPSESPASAPDANPVSRLLPPDRVGIDTFAEGANDLARLHSSAAGNKVLEEPLSQFMRAVNGVNGLAGLATTGRLDRGEYVLRSYVVPTAKLDDHDSEAISEAHADLQSAIRNEPLVSSHLFYFSEPVEDSSFNGVIEELFSPNSPEHDLLSPLQALTYGSREALKPTPKQIRAPKIPNMEEVTVATPIPLNPDHRTPWLGDK